MFESPPVRRNRALSACNHDDRGEGSCLPGAFNAIVAGCQRGDRDAQRQLYEFHHQQVYRLSVRMVGRQEADDVTQQVFLQVLRKIGQFSGQSRLETWLYRVAVNECLQHLRRNGRHRVNPLLHDPTDRSASSTQQSEDVELLERSMQRLDPDLRTIFVLREVEQMSYHEIASTLDISEGTVASRLNRARRLLRQYLVELGWGNDDEPASKESSGSRPTVSLAR